MSRGMRPAVPRYGHRDKLSSRGVVPDLLTNLPSPVKRRPSLGSAKKKTERKKEEKEEKDGVTFINIEGAKQDGAAPSTEEILQKAQEKDPKCVFEIDLRDSGLTEVPNLKEFPKTRIVDLSSNKIQRIVYLFNIKNYVSFTRLVTSFDYTTIQALFKCGEVSQELRELKLYDNKIRCLEGLDDLKELTILQLQHNEISSIGSSLQALKKLKQLRLDSNRLRLVTTKELCSCAQITCLDLSFNQLTSIDAIVCLPNLDEFFASHNKITTLPALNRCKKLTELRLNNNSIADAQGLKGANSLRILDLSNNHLLGLKLAGQLSNLEYLNVSGNHLEEVECFGNNFPSVDVLDISRNRIEDPENCIASLKKMQSLCELSITCNPCSAALSTSISSQLPTLELLDGVVLRRASAGSKPNAGPMPVMRPMSASTVISAKFVENQINAMKEMMEPFESKVTSCYSSLRQSIDQLPREPPKSARLDGTEEQNPAEGSRPTTRSGRRNRIKEAQDFARSMNFEA